MNGFLLLWAGTDETLAVYKAALEKFVFAAVDPKALTYEYQAEKEEELPRLLSIHDGVGVVSIKGALTNSDDWWVRYHGMTSYSEIREAMVVASQNALVFRILMDIGSGGGSASGMLATAELIKQVDKIKPVWAFSESTVASAAYGLMSGARKKIITKDTIAGSIGVIATILEYSEMMKADGVTPEIFRSGKWKALGNPYEPLTEFSRGVIQAQVDEFGALFTRAVAENIGTPFELVHEKMGQGREFLGVAAKDVGLVDDISTFDKTLTQLQKKAAASSNPMTTGGFIMSGKKKAALSEAEIAAAAAVAGIEAAQQGVEESKVEEPKAELPEQPVESKVEEPKAEVAELEKAKADLATASAKISLLEEQLKAAQDAMVDLKAEIKISAKEVDNLQAAAEPLKKIVAGAINTMAVALGGTRSEELEKLSAVDLVSRHAEAAKQFTSKFRVGPVASPSAESEEVLEDNPKVTPIHRAAVRAAKTR